VVKGTRLLENNNIDISILRGTKEYLIKHFAFCIITHTKFIRTLSIAQAIGYRS